MEGLGSLMGPFLSSWTLLHDGSWLVVRGKGLVSSPTHLGKWTAVPLAMNGNYLLIGGCSSRTRVWPLTAVWLLSASLWLGQALCSDSASGIMLRVLLGTLNRGGGPQEAFRIQASGF